jgi:hypothetical protein
MTNLKTVPKALLWIVGFLAITLLMLYVMYLTEQYEIRIRPFE